VNDNGKTIFAAAVIFAGFLLLAWFLPDIMLAAANISPWVAGAVVVVFLLGFFALLWIRSRTKRD
jgi:Flp pilus assembly protein TadB